jgi:hypothetical protein
MANDELVFVVLSPSSVLLCSIRTTEDRLRRLRLRVISAQLLLLAMSNTDHEDGSIIEERRLLPTYPPVTISLSLAIQRR